MIKYKLTIKVRSWLDKDKKSSTEMTETDVLFFENMSDALNRLRQIDLNRQGYLGNREAEIIKLRVDKIELIKEIEYKYK